MSHATLLAPKHFCATPGCPARVSSGHCDAHRQQQTRTREARRTPSHPLLHRQAWRRYSRRRLALHPWCVGYPTGVHGTCRVLANCTDHILAAKARPDLFWNEANHQSLCAECNSRKGIAEEGGFDLRRDGGV